VKKVEFFSFQLSSCGHANNWAANPSQPGTPAVSASQRCHSRTGMTKAGSSVTSCSWHNISEEMEQLRNHKSRPLQHLDLLLNFLKAWKVVGALEVWLPLCTVCNARELCRRGLRRRASHGRGGSKEEKEATERTRPLGWGFNALRGSVGRALQEFI